MLSSYNPQDRYRRKAMDRMAGIITVVVLVFLSFGIGFWMGKQNAGSEARTFKKQLLERNAEHAALQDTLTELRAETQTAQARYKQLQETYEETLPEGPMQDLVLMLKKQVDEGRDPDRLAFLIRSARPPQNCTEAQTRRFVVRTPAYRGPDSKVAIADGAIVVKGSGRSAMNVNGRPEAWFDPSKKVSLVITSPERGAEQKNGTLPLKHSVVVGNKEYRLTVSDGARSFAKVTYDSCDYP